MIQFIALLLLAVVFGAPPLRGADLDQAKKEGEVVLYTTMIVSDFQVFQKALVKKYPFLKVNHVRLGASTLVSRAIAEFRAGKHLTDVYWRRSGFAELYARAGHPRPVCQSRGEVHS